MAAEPSSAYRFGLEEEFFLVSPATRRAPSRVPKAFLKLCRQHFGAYVGSELLQSQVEVSSPVFDHAAAARTQMTQLRRGLAGLAETAGLRLVAAGTHPLSAWHQQTQTDKSRYDRIIDDFQMVGRRSLLCGLHVHVAPPGDVDRVVLMNRLMPWLPPFLALSALFRCLVRAHVRRPGLGQARTALTRRIVDENRWRAKRFGPDAGFIDEPTGEMVGCARMLDAAIELVAEDAHAPDCEADLQQLRTIVARGTSAQEQLALHHRLRSAGSSNTEALRAVVDWLAETSIAVSD